jgi:MFS family permease
MTELAEIEGVEPPFPKHDPYAVLREPGYRYYLAGNFLAILGYKMQTVAVGWEIYQRTKDPKALGLIGLIQFLPVFFLALFAGHIADRFDRKRIILIGLPFIATASLAMAYVSRRGDEIWVLYALLLVNSIARAFQQPAKSALLPQIVDRAHFPSAVTWNTGAMQLAFVVGPALGGFAIALFAGGEQSFLDISLGDLVKSTPLTTAESIRGTAVVYVMNACAAAAFFAFLWFAKPRPMARDSDPLTFHSLMAGVRFVFSQKVMLAAISLDLFAVLLGGATALLPVYASKEFLNVGPVGMGWMEAAPALGAVLMALWIAHRPPFERAGAAMLLSVVGFGAATIVFGLSRSYPISLAMLFLTGAFDNISVVIRHTLMQVLTPDAMRGRVSAINGMFIGASNELGAYESGQVAGWTSPTFSVVSGGIGTILVVVALSILSPGLRRFGRLTHESKVES